MLPRLFASLRIRLIILVLLAALPAFVLVTYGAATQRQHELEEAQEDALLFTRRIVSDQDGLLRSSRALLATFAQVRQIQDKDVGPCNELMATLLAENPAYANLYAGDSSGTVFCSALPSGLGVSMADRDYFQAALASSTYAMSKYQIGRASGKPTMAIGYPFRDTQGKVAGVVAVSINLDWFLEKTTLSTLPAGSTLLVLDDKATVLAVRPHNSSLVGSPLKSSEALRKTLTTSPGTTEAEGPDGKQQLWASAPIGNEQGGAPIAYVSVSTPLDAAFAEANQRFSRNFLLLGTALLVALGAAWWLGDVLVGKRIQALVQASKRLAGGDYAARSGLRPSEGELGQLTHSFDEMATALERRQAEREQANRMLQESEARYRAVVENASDGISIVADNRITYANRAFLQIHGLKDPGQALGADPTGFVLPEYRDMMRQRLAARLRGEPVEGMYERKIQRPDGEVRALQVSGATITLNGKLAALGIARDVTNPKRMEEKLRESEERYRAVVENAHVGFAITRGEQVLYVNNSLVAIYGLKTIAEALQQSRDVLVMPEDLAHFRERALLRQEAHQIADVIEYRIRRPDGVIRTLQGSGVNISHQGQPARLSEIRDITAQRQAESSLQESEAQYRAVVENASDGIGIVVDRKLEFANRAYFNIFGVSDPARLLGSDPSEFALPEYREVLHQRGTARLRGEQISEQFEYEIRRPSGEIRAVQLSGAVITYGGKRGNITILRDITERVRRDEELREANHRLAQALEELQKAQAQEVRQERLNALGQMASGIVHDFNNALTPILGFTSLLIDSPEKLDDRESTLHYLNICRSAGQDALHIVERLRGFYRPREQAEPFVSLDINEVVQRAHTLTQYVWEDKAASEGKAVALTLDLGVVPPIAGNPTELTEVLTNLIINAVDAIPASGSINIRTTLENESVVLEVRDSGAGMPEEVRRRCFEPFFTTKGEKGTGLGLAVTYGVIQRHGGRIEVESQVGVGTTFRIWLPATA